MNRAQVKRKAVEMFGNVCNRCSQTFPDCVYAFHHLDPNVKSFSIGSGTTNWEEVVEELKKCIMLCHNCHSIIECEIREKKRRSRE